MSMKLNVFGEEVTLSEEGEKKMKEALEDIKANRAEPKFTPKELKYMNKKIGKI